MKIVSCSKFLVSSFPPKPETRNLKPETRGSVLVTQSSELRFLLNQPIRSGQHIRWNRETDLLCGFEIDHQLKLRRLLHRQVRRLSAFQDLVHIASGAAV